MCDLCGCVPCDVRDNPVQGGICVGCGEQPDGCTCELLDEEEKLAYDEEDLDDEGDEDLDDDEDLEEEEEEEEEEEDFDDEDDEDW
ncbi:hypothetical protein [Anaerobaca lacustris]|uniref:Uncharacterized protein n=1 Tax=Anaerobaca lacustris TaxID=3044600 RepID=A0AAW6TYH0_9BACT|nr:hypothetical protein [Sedimentisphaerales bacterium M17dextr]